MKNKILCLAIDGFEEIELLAPTDLMRRAGYEVTLASLAGLTLTGKCGVKIGVDARLSDINAHAYDALYLPGGPGVEAMLKDGRAASLAKAYLERDKYVIAICAAPLVLQAAGVLAGRKFTAYSSVQAELPGCLDAAVVVDGKLITACGPGASIALGLQIIASLSGAEAATKISKEIMYDKLL